VGKLSYGYLQPISSAYNHPPSLLYRIDTQCPARMNTQPKVLRTKTPGFAHHSIAFSPFFEDRIAVASGANFGLVGNGRVHILSLTPGGLGVVKWYDHFE